MAKQMEIWLEAAGEKLQLPIVPETVEVSFETGNTTQQIQTYGEVFIFGKRGCRTLTLDTWWPDPDNEYGFLACKPALKPYKFVTKINSWKYEIIKVTLTGTNVRGLKFGLMSFTAGETDASGDLKYTMSLTEYRMPTFTRTEKTIPKTYVVKEGDNLLTIAKKLTGKEDNWGAIFNDNKAIITTEGLKRGEIRSDAWTHVYPGMELVINL